jgi:O-antigen ligase
MQRVFFLLEYIGTNLERRFENEYSEDSRYVLIKEAIEVGFENPIFGVGPGNFGQYSTEKVFSHCSFTELFANNGVIGLILFLVLFQKLFKSIKILYFRKNGDKVPVYLFVGVVVYFIYNLFYVFYLNLNLFGFLFVMIGHIHMKNKDLIGTNFKSITK